MAFDIHIEGVPRDEVKNQRFLSFGDYEKIYAVQGIQKMVNRYLKCLLTPLGTDISDSNYGTRLMSLFLGNVDTSGLRQVVNMSVTGAETKIREYDVQNGAPSDERLSSVAIESFSVDEANRGFELILLLKNSAGTTVRVLVPELENYGA